MTEQEHIYHQIEEYIQGSLPPSDTEKIKYLIDNDPVYRDIYEDINLNNQVVLGAAFTRLREKMQADLQTIEQKRSRQQRLIKNSGLIVGFIGLLSGTILLINPSERHETAVSDSLINTIGAGQKPSVDEHYPIKDSGSSDIKEPHALTENYVTGISEKAGENVIPDTMLQSEVRENTVPKQSDYPLTDSVQKEKPGTATVLAQSQSVPDKLNLIACDSITAEFLVSPSCNAQSTGKIAITGIKGGEIPYDIYIDGYDISGSHEADNLKAGWYTLKVYDNKRCSSTRKIQVPSENCFDDKAFSFNPDFGEIWNIPFISGQSGYFRIISRNGTIIYESPFGADWPNEWKGIDKTGTIVEYGMYICLLEYEDGHVEKIQVTIIR